MQLTHAGRALALAALLLIGTAHASAPQQKNQAPGYYRLMVGDIEVTALNDGLFHLKVSELLNAEPGEVDAALTHMFLKEPVDTSVNGFLVNTGTKLVLVDTGCGAYCGPETGKLVQSLKAAGYAPEQVDEIYITHFHGDHVGGLIADGQRVFANATVRADKRESDFWLSQANMDKAPDNRKDTFKGAMGALNPYVSAGKFKPFDGDSELVPGVRAVASYGHTPGHTAYRVDSGGQTLMLWGDLMHVAAVQFPHPAVTIKFDSDSTAAAATRAKAYADAAKNGWWVASAHLSFPAFGHIAAQGSGYHYVPANYSVPH
jgi:glyoxylase-like metal-dependent hydrolase (beta-lactamase superfamily II)